MRRYPIHTLDSAPSASKSALKDLHDAFGVLPNIAAAMANSPVLLNSLVGLFSQVHGGHFDERQIQVVLLTNAVANRCAWAVAFHTALAHKEGVPAEEIDRIRAGEWPLDVRHAALSRVARTLIDKRGLINTADSSAFLSAGFTDELLLEVVAIVAASTITNYTGNITRPPLEAMIESYAWGGE